MLTRLKPILTSLTVLITLLIFCSAYAVESVPEESLEKKIKPGTVTGRIMVKDKEDMPLAWGQILFYNVSTGPPPKPAKYERIPDMWKNINAEGRFTVELPEGRYYMGAVKRLSGEEFGPPQNGDYVFISLNEQGRPKEYYIQEGTFLDVGTIAEAIPLDRGILGERRITTAIEGTIVDTDFKPVKGAVVTAFAQPTLGMNPLFVSDKTDEKGKYILPVTEGTYYLRVRNRFAPGPPVHGEIIGYYGDRSPAPVPVPECKIVKGTDFQVILFPGRGPFSGTATKKK